MSLPRMTEMAHMLTAQFINEGDITIDATCGNGNDTFFLAKLVGESGQVYAFDIQNDALQRSTKIIEQAGLQQRVKFIHDSHEHMDRWVTNNIKGIMFNLGYLPQGDKEITTLASSSLKAIKLGLNLLCNGGIMTICLYPGHSQGKLEADAILPFVKDLDPSYFKVIKYELINQNNVPPYLIGIMKNY